MVYAVLLLLIAVLCNLTYADSVVPLSVLVQSRRFTVNTIDPITGHSPASPYNSATHITPHLLSHLRSKHELSVPGVGSVSDVSVDEYDITSLTMLFPSPLHVTTAQTHTHTSSLHGAFELECPGGVRLPLSGSFPSSVWSADDQTHTHTLPDVLLLADDADNLYRHSLQSFNLFQTRPLSGLPKFLHTSGALATLELITVSRHTRTHPDGSRVVRKNSVFGVDLKECSLEHLPTTARTNTRSNTHTASIAVDGTMLASVKRRLALSLPAVPVKVGVCVGPCVTEVGPFKVSLAPTPTNTPSHSNIYSRLTFPTVPVVEVSRHAQRTVFRSPSDAAAKAHALKRLKSGLAVGDVMHGENPDVSVLLQLDSALSVTGGGMMARMIKPAVGGLAKPVLDLTSGLIMDMFANHFMKKLYTSIITEVSPDLGMMLGNSLKTQLTNSLVDSITYSVSESLNPNLVRVIAPVVSSHVTQWVPRRVAPMLDRLLFEKISKHVLDHLPSITSRALQLSLTHGLTRSITQALVPALTHTISHHTNSDYYCNHCFQTANKQSCSLCHFSDSTVYYQLYYAAYYADYYSKYYTTYYVHAVRRVDEIKHKTYNSPGSTLLPQTEKYVEDSGRSLAE